MLKILVVANQTVGGGEFSEAIKSRVERDQCEFHLVVPVTGSKTSASTVVSVSPEVAPTMAYDIPDNRRLAQQQLALGLEWIKGLGSTATGEVVADDDTVDVVVDAVEKHSINEVIVSTLHHTLSRWLRRDLPSKIERRVSVPVTVVSPAES